jgi:hypothetical protein
MGLKDYLKFGLILYGLKVGAPPLLIALVLFLAISDCKKDKERNEQIQQMLATCQAQSGVECPAPECKGTAILSFSPGENGTVCCPYPCGQTGPPEQQQTNTSTPLTNATTNTTTTPTQPDDPTLVEFFQYVTGDQGLSCAAQDFERCVANEFCEDGAWARAADTAYCCSTNCRSRIQDTLTVGAETFIVEKVNTGIIVWYGEAIPLIGTPNFVEAVLEENQYRFTLPTQVSHYFTATITATSIDVVSTEQVCSDVITPACHTVTQQLREFPTSCLDDGYTTDLITCCTSLSFPECHSLCTANCVPSACGDDGICTADCGPESSCGVTS